LEEKEKKEETKYENSHSFYRKSDGKKDSTYRQPREKSGKNSV